MTYTIDRILTGYTLDEAESRVRDALSAQGFGVLTEIDVSATMKKKLDKEMAGYKILGACNPNMAWQAIGLEPKIGAMLPCNVILREVDSGIEVSAIDPLASMAAIDNERLKAVATHNELGAGMQLAMKDLEIRGAGNLLGGEQSGHIAGVGFDLYLRMVGEAVADFKGEEDTAPAEVKVELPVNAHLPHDYVPGERLRLEMYRNLAQAADDAAVDAVVEELKDRYGPLPEPVEALVAVARFRNRARAAGVTEVMLLGQNVKFGPAADLPESRQMRLTRMYKGAQVKPALNGVLIPRPKTKPVMGQDLVDVPLLEWAQQVVDAIFAPEG